MRISNLASLQNSHFIALMGQSNANGFQDPPDTATYTPTIGQYIFNNVSQQWEALQQNQNNGGDYQVYTGSVGIEMTLMQLLKNHYGADQYLFKYGHGGTSLGPTTDSSYDWVPGTSEPYMYNGCVSSLLAAKRLFPAQRPKLKVLIWIQGENDCDPVNANNYQANFLNFINNLKNSWNNPNLKVLQTLLADTQTSFDPVYKNIVNTGKINYSINGNRYVSTDGADCPNGVHFTAAGQADIAQRVFDVLITML